MSKTTKIVDGTGSGNSARVSEEGFLFTQEAPFPPVGLENKLTVYREFLTLNGDGSTTEVETAVG